MRRHKGGVQYDLTYRRNERSECNPSSNPAATAFGSSTSPAYTPRSSGSTAMHPIFPELPTSRIEVGFTTCPSTRIPGVHPVALSDKVLGAHKVTSSTKHPLTAPPVTVPGSDADALAWEAAFLEGSINPGNKTAPPGGFGFYLTGAAHFAKAVGEAQEGDEVMLSYDVLFEDGFEWVKGGKLPGICECRVGLLGTTGAYLSILLRWRGGAICIWMYGWTPTGPLQVLQSAHDVAVSSCVPSIHVEDVSVCSPSPSSCSPLSYPGRPQRRRRRRAVPIRPTVGPKYPTTLRRPSQIHHAPRLRLLSRSWCVPVRLGKMDADSPKSTGQWYWEAGW